MGQIVETVSGIAVALECAYFIWYLHDLDLEYSFRPQERFILYVLFFFVGTGLAGLSRALVYALGLGNQSFSYFMLWRLHLIAVALAVAAIWSLGVYFVLTSWQKAIHIVAGAYFSLISVYILINFPNYGLVFHQLVPSYVFLLMAFIANFTRRRSTDLKVGIAGAALVLVATVRMNYLLGNPFYFQNMILYRLIQMGGLFCLFYCLKIRVESIKKPMRIRK